MKLKKVLATTKIEVVQVDDELPFAARVCSDCDVSNCGKTNWVDLFEGEPQEGFDSKIQTRWARFLEKTSKRICLREVRRVTSPCNCIFCLFLTQCRQSHM